MDGPSLPRSIRWRLQLGVFSLPEKESEKSTYAWKELWAQNSKTCQVLRLDYARLQQEWKDFYEKQQRRRQEEEEDDDEDDDYVQLTTDIDPLTAMLEEKTAKEERLEQLEKKFKKEKAMRKRGMYNEDESPSSSQYPLSEHEYSSFSSSWSLVEKDLHRLPREHHEYYYKLQSLKVKSSEYANAVKERTLRLTEMLQIYAKQHPHIGYRQGMHELISYCLLVVEMDTYYYEKSKQKKQNINNENNSNNSNRNTPPRLWEDSEEEGFWDSSCVAHDAYGMFQVLMDPLAPAYDVNPTAISQEPIQTSAAETRGQAILELIRTIASDDVLYNHLMDLQCPPELYTTRWVRLLFSREVQGNLNVLLLWDVFLDLWSTTSKISSLHPSRYTRPGVSPPLQLGHWNLLEILETTAASMILLQRSALLQLSSGDCDASHSDSIHRLMNIPPLKNILPLTATVLSMMRRRQVHNTTKSNEPAEQTAATSTRSSQSMSNNSSNRNVFSEMVDAVDKFSAMWGNTAITTTNNNSNDSGRSNSDSNHRKKSNTVNNYPASGVSSERASSISTALNTTLKAKSTSNLVTPTTATTSASSGDATTANNNDDLDQKFHGDNSSSSSRNRRSPFSASNQRDVVLSSQLNEAIFTVKQFLLQVEIRSSEGDDLVPSTVWSALEQMESVQKELRHTPNSSTMRGNDF